ncbi:MAG: hypothetical protein NFW16_20135, partial [Candidatus Accumulibacter sp.]|uniref:hypothetical protein n=1 Tax=Accumulibacter sp. TaxID=2053492 RepID=UPI00258EEF23
MVTPDRFSLRFKQPPHSRLRGMVGVTLGLLSIVPLLDVGIVYLENPRLKQQAFADLNAIAALKAGQIEAWLDERRADAIVLGTSPGFIEDAVRVARDEDADARRRLAACRTLPLPPAEYAKI